MIVDKRPPIPDDDTPVEAPPAYYDALGSTYPPQEKSESPSDETSAGTLGTTSPEPLSLKSPSSEHGKSSPGWFTFGLRARTAKQVRETVMGLMRDLVKQPQIDRSTISIIENCADACRSYGLSMSSILQEPFAENHTLIYWAIIKRTPEHLAPTDNSSPDLVSVLLSLAAPLTDATISEIRLACLHNSDHVLFQRLRHSPAFAPLSGTEEMLLGGSIPPDEIEVQDVVDDDDDAAFIARFRVPMFQKRLRVSKQINLEFIARGMCPKFMLRSFPMAPCRAAVVFEVSCCLGGQHAPPTHSFTRHLVCYPLAFGAQPTNRSRLTTDSRGRDSSR